MDDKSCVCLSFIRSSKDTELFSCVSVMKSGHTRGNVVFMCQPDEGYVNAFTVSVTNCTLFDVSIITVRLFKQSHCVTFAEMMDCPDVLNSINLFDGV